jgi:hypothetical protein
MCVCCVVISVACGMFRSHIVAIFRKEYYKEHRKIYKCKVLSCIYIYDYICICIYIYDYICIYLYL